ncbi:roundabout1-like, partial [Tropilaelaps mercedesae]
MTLGVRPLVGLVPIVIGRLFGFRLVRRNANKYEQRHTRQFSSERFRWSTRLRNARRFEVLPGRFQVIVGFLSGACGNQPGLRAQAEIGYDFAAFQRGSCPLKAERELSVRCLVHLADEFHFARIGNHSVRSSSFLGKPTFIQRPEDVAVVSADANGVRLECAASGDPQPAIRWTHNGKDVKELASAFSSSIKVLGRSRPGVSSTLEVIKLSPDDQGEYVCEASNALGTVKASAHITIE